MSANTIKESPDNDLYILPSNNEEMRKFIIKYKVDMMEQVVSSIEFALKHDFPFVEIFQFKNSKFVVTMDAKEFDDNLSHIYKYYLESEKYELCPKIIALQNRLREN